jgi:hypothetical protein
VETPLELGDHPLALLRRVAPLGERLHRVLARHLDEPELVAALGHEDRDLLPAPLPRYSARASASEIATGSRISSGTSWFVAW